MFPEALLFCNQYFLFFAAQLYQEQKNFIHKLKYYFFHCLLFRNE